VVLERDTLVHEHRFAGGVLGHVHPVEVADGELVGVELEGAGHRLEVGALEGRAQGLDVVGLAAGLVVGALIEQVAALKNPPMTREQVLDRLRDCGLVQSMAKLRELLGGR